MIKNWAPKMVGLERLPMLTHPQARPYLIIITSYIPLCNKVNTLELLTDGVLYLDFDVPAVYKIIIL